MPNNNLNFDLQPTLQSEFLKLRPLMKTDFELLYAVASNPLIWEQHPNKDRYKREVFETFFKGAMESKGAFIVLDAKTNEPIGSSRFYELDEQNKSIAIGYTFLAKDHWGTTYNRSLKSLMIDHAFTYFSAIIFHIGAINIRSQKAIERLGAIKISEVEMEYYGETTKLNFVYQIKKEDWKK